MKNIFKDDYNINSLKKIVTFGTNIKFFLTPRYMSHYVSNEYESFSIEILKKILPKNGTFLDIGAHYGYYSCVATKFCNAKIIAVEAVPENYNVLVKNLKINNSKIIRTENLVVSDKNEKVNFQIVEASDSASLYGHPLTKTIRTINLLAKTADSILDNVVPDIIKIDVEGHEIKVLDGLKKTLKKNSQLAILIEFNPKCQKAASNNPVDLLNKISNLGFDIYVVDEDLKQLHKLANLDIWTELVPVEQYRNLLCIKSKTLLKKFGLSSKSKPLLAIFFSHSSQLGGSERSMLELMLELREKNIFSHVVLPGPGPLEKELKDNNIPCDMVNLSWWAKLGKMNFEEIISNNSNSFNNLINYLPELSQLNPDLIYSNTLVSPWGAVAANYLDLPHIWHIREYGELDHKLNFDAPYNEIINFTETYSDEIVVNSKSVAEHISKYLKTKKPQIAYNYVTIDKNLLKEKIVSPFKIKNSLKVLICGTLSRGKNQLEAIRSIKELIKNGTNIELLLVGGVADENYLQEINDYIAEHQIKNYVHILNFVANPYPYFKISDVVLISSKKEAYGRTAIEAMLLKKPVVATLEGGTKEIIKDNISGFIYEADNNLELQKILLKLQDKTLQKKIGLEGFKSLKQINNKDQYGYKIAEIIKNTIKNHRPNNQLTKIAIYTFIKSLENLQKKQNELENQLSISQKSQNDLREQLTTIFSSKTYRIWQAFNKVKKYIHDFFNF